VRLLVATRNAGKKREYERLLEGLGLELVTLEDLGIDLEVAETGDTFAANALLKAAAYAEVSGLPTLADDSGLEVDALGGAPGVRSARYAAEAGAATDEDRYRVLLERLRDVPEAERTARFRCVIAVAWPDGAVDTAEGAVEGRIAASPRGQHGFGYDPVFYMPEYGRTMAELGPEVKNRISHRARAALAIRPALARRVG
jgi:XTP/dITP diphosphohydrolase